MEPRLLLEGFPPQAGLERGTARPVCQRLTHLAIRAPVYAITTGLPGSALSALYYKFVQNCKNW